ncbi:hypothetical protein NQZ68_005176 [Dissostichus eleginoides]|nr:hypothetical protein NQZ68_005176 [Dissostichus eleginoides]
MYLAGPLTVHRRQLHSPVRFNRLFPQSAETGAKVFLDVASSEITDRDREFSSRLSSCQFLNEPNNLMVYQWSFSTKPSKEKALDLLHIEGSSAILCGSVSE